MKRVIKQLAAVLLTVIMTVGMGISAWADDAAATVVTLNPATVTVVVDGMADDDQVTAYPIVTYGENYNSYVFDNTSSKGFQSYIENVKTAAGHGSLSNEDYFAKTLDDSGRSKLLGDFAAECKKSSPIYVFPTASANATASGTSAKLENLTPGYYLLDLSTTTANSRIYKPVSVFVAVENNRAVVNGVTADSDGTYHVTAKSGDGPTIEKKVKDGTEWKNAASAGIGENAVGVRKDIIDGMTWFGCEIDDDKNNVHGEEAVISTDDSKIKLLLVPTDEELMIARDVERLK